jgi:DNA-binding MarR family transcriptional regulator
MSPNTPPGETVEARAEVAALMHDQFARLTRELRNLELPPGITPERLSTLSTIERRGPISVTTLADLEMVRPATMSRMVSGLVDEGLVKRGDDKADGRGVLVTTTTKGRRVYQRAQEQRLRDFAQALEHLSHEQFVAIRALTPQLECFTLIGVKIG